MSYSIDGMPCRWDHGGLVAYQIHPVWMCKGLQGSSSEVWLLQEDSHALARVATQNTVALLLLSKVLSNGKLEHTVSWDFSVHCCYPVLGLKKQ